MRSLFFGALVLAGCSASGSVEMMVSNPNDAGSLAQASNDAGVHQDPLDAGEVNTDAGSPRDAGSSPLGRTPGKFVHKPVLEGIEREFIVYVPELAAGSEPVPVVFMFHGTSGDGQKFFQISGWREKADEDGFIAVFPSGLTYCFKEDENHDGDFEDRGERKITTKWVAGQLGASAEPLCSESEVAMLSAEQRALVDHAIPDDVAFVRSMLDFMTANYGIDPARVYASGFSNGGQFTSRLAVDAADRFTAIAAAAGTMAVTPMPAARPISFVFTVGEKDDRFTTPWGVDAIPMSESLLTDYPAVKTKLVDDYLLTLGLTSDYRFDERTINGERVVRWTFATSAIGAGNSLEMAIIQDATHEYPNGTNHPIKLVNFLWEFFKAHSIE